MELTEQMEEYLETISKLVERESEVTVSSVAEYMSLSPAAVSEMIKRMEEKNLVKRRHRHGLILTGKGEKIARTIIRRHRLSERFLTDMLGMSWENAHEQACRLEHAIGPEMEDRLAQILGNPSTCPHGHPIPDQNGKISESESCSLSELKVGESGKISIVEEENREMLCFLSSLGLMPGTEISIIDIAPFNGPMTVRMGDSRYALGSEVTDCIKISKVNINGPQTMKRRRGKR